jgi:hypothetical protein
VWLHQIDVIGDGLPYHTDLFFRLILPQFHLLYIICD